jgi:hypothetical protein
MCDRTLVHFMLLYHFRAPRNVPMDISLDIPLFHLDLSLDLAPDVHHLDSNIISPDVASGALINHPLINSPHRHIYI